MHESISHVPSDYSDKIDSDNPRLGVVPSENVVHMPLFHQFLTKDHFNKSAADYSFMEGDFTP